jgi:4-aminobutyrate aminotransferase-like enzyme
VADRVSLAPDGRLAVRVQNGMRERGVLVGTTGRAGNTLKVRPPLVLTGEDAALLVRVLDESLAAATS